jgi:ribonuclease P protein component
VQTFSKNERLNSQIIIDKLFEKGKSFNNFPLKIIWIDLPEEFKNSQVLFSVPKRLFKKAVDRNRLKRIMRECYRKNKMIFQGEENKRNVGVVIVYLNKEIISYQEMNEKIISSLERLKKEIL